MNWRSTTVSLETYPLYSLIFSLDIFFAVPGRAKVSEKCIHLIRWFNMYYKRIFCKLCSIFPSPEGARRNTSTKQNICSHYKLNHRIGDLLFHNHFTKTKQTNFRSFKAAILLLRSFALLSGEIHGIFCALLWLHLVKWHGGKIMHNSESLVQVNHTQPLLNISADAKVFISTVTQISNETNLTHQKIVFFVSLYILLELKSSLYLKELKNTRIVI